MGDIKITTEVAGRICDLLMKAGESVAAGDDIALVEAMKMETTITATADPQISAIHLTEGSLVNTDDLVLTLS